MLADRGLPHNVFEIFVRAPERELEVAELPGCGRAAILAQYIDDWIIYWLGLADGSIWMTKGDPGQPAENIEKINTTVTGLQKVLAAWCDLKSSGITETTIRAPTRTLSPSPTSVQSAPTRRSSRTNRAGGR